MSDPLEKEFKFFLDNRRDFQKRYRGKIIVIRDQKVVGSYPSEMEAIEASLKMFEAGTFLVQKCLEGDDSFRKTFRSRAVFA